MRSKHGTVARPLPNIDEPPCLSLSLSLALPLSLPPLSTPCFSFHLYVFNISPTLCPFSLLFSPLGIPVDTDTSGARLTRQRVLNGVQKQQRDPGGGYEKRERVVLFSLPLIFLVLSVCFPSFLLSSLPFPTFPLSLLKLYNRNGTLSDADISDTASAVSASLSSPVFLSGFSRLLRPSSR